MASGLGTAMITGTGSAKSDPKREIKVRDYNFSADNLEAKIWMDDMDISKESTAELGLQLKNTIGEDITLLQSCTNSVNSIEGTRNRGNVKAVLVGRMNTWKDKNGRWFASEDELYPDRPDQQTAATLSKGESYRMQYQLWGHSGSPYLPPGTYTFKRDIIVEGVTETLSLDITVSTK
jgi:hypothetical protein